MQATPTISVREWLVHTSHMLVYEWFPLTYFCVSTLVAPKDPYGCHTFTLERCSALLFYVFAPILAMRFVGVAFFLKERLIIYQIAVIYSYMLISLTLWQIESLEGMAN